MKGGTKVVVTDVSMVPDGGVLLAIHVKLDGEEGEDLLRVTHSHFKRKYGTAHCRETMIKATFPLMLRYAMTQKEVEVIIDSMWPLDCVNNLIYVTT